MMECWESSERRHMFTSRELQSEVELEPQGHTSHCFVYELLTGVKVSLQYQTVVQVCEHGVLQGYARLLLQRLEGFRVVVLPEVLEAEPNGFLFSVLKQHDGQQLYIDSTT